MRNRAPGTNAITIAGPRPAVALYADFFGPPDLQSKLSQAELNAFWKEKGNVALHELVHVLGWSDDRIFGDSTFQSNGLDITDYQGFGNTGAFTDWLANDCRKK